MNNLRYDNYEFAIPTMREYNALCREATEHGYTFRNGSSLLNGDVHSNQWGIYLKDTIAIVDASNKTIMFQRKDKVVDFKLTVDDFIGVLNWGCTD